MTRIQRRGDGRAEIDVSETEHEIAGLKHNALHLLDGIKPIDAADEFDVARAPRRIGPHVRLIFVDRLLRSGIIPRKWQMHDSRRHFQIIAGVIASRSPDQIEQRVARAAFANRSGSAGSEYPASGR